MNSSYLTYLSLICLILICSLTIYSQEAHPAHWELSIKNGLPSNTVYDLLLDKKGYVWIGTEKGLCRFNGTGFLHFSNQKQKQADITGLGEAPDGTIWAMNFRSQVFYIKQDSMHLFDKVDSLPPSKSRIHRFLIDKNGGFTLCRESEKVLYNYNAETKNWNKFIIPERFFSIINGTKESIFTFIPTDNINEFYLFTGRKVLHYDSGTTRIVPYDSELGNYLFNLPIGVGHFYWTNNKQLLFTTQNHTIYNPTYIAKFENDTIKKMAKLVDNDFFSYRLNENAVSGELFLQMLGTGLVSIDINNNSSQSVKHSKRYFPTESVSSFLVDQEDNYWISTLDNGIKIIPNRKIESLNLNTDFIEKNDLFGIEALGKNGIVLTDRNGQMLHFQSKNKFFQPIWKKNKNPITHFKKLTNNLLVASNKNYFEIFNLDNDQKRKGYSHNSLKTIIAYKNKFLIQVKSSRMVLLPIRDMQIISQKSAEFNYLRTSFHKDRGIQKYNLDINKNSWHKTDSIRDSRYFDIAKSESHNRFFLAVDKGLYVYPEWGANRFPILHKDAPIVATKLHYDKQQGLLWAYNSNEIWGIDTSLMVQYHFPKEKQQLPDRIVQIISEHRVLWCRTESGILQLPIETGDTKFYDISDGLTSKNIKDFAILDDFVWYIDELGLHRFPKNMEDVNELQPSCYIEMVHINDVPIASQDSFKLTFEENTFQFDIDAVDYRTRGDYQFNYRLKGLDNNWKVQPSSNTFVRYPKLNPGSYTFEVRVINSDGIPGKQIQRMYFKIAPPFWRTVWFYVLCALCLIGLLAGGMYLRIQNIKKRNEIELEKERLTKNMLDSQLKALRSQMNPHFIFNALNSIQDLVLRQETDRSYDYLVLFAQLVRNSLSYSEKEFIPIEDEIEFLDIYLKLEKLRFEEDFTYEIIQPKLDDLYIPSLTIQPFIENALKHGLLHKKGKKKLQVIFEYGDQLKCKIIDNGIGRVKADEIRARQAPEHQSFSISAIKQRLAILEQQFQQEASYHVKDLYDQNGEAKGTEVLIILPFKQQFLN